MTGLWKHVAVACGFAFLVCVGAAPAAKAQTTQQQQQQTDSTLIDGVNTALGALGTDAQGNPLNLQTATPDQIAAAIQSVASAQSVSAGSSLASVISRTLTAVGLALAQTGNVNGSVDSITSQVINASTSGLSGADRGSVRSNAQASIASATSDPGRVGNMQQTLIAFSAGSSGNGPGGGGGTVGGGGGTGLNGINPAGGGGLPGGPTAGGGSIGGGGGTPGGLTGGGVNNAIAQNFFTGGGVGGATSTSPR